LLNCLLLIAKEKINKKPKEILC